MNATGLPPEHSTNVGKEVVFFFAGVRYSGTIESYVDYGTLAEPDRYVEFRHNDASAGKTGDPAYVKEGPDRVTGMHIV